MPARSLHCRHSAPKSPLAILKPSPAGLPWRGVRSALPSLPESRNWSADPRQYPDSRLRLRVRTIAPNRAAANHAALLRINQARSNQDFSMTSARNHALAALGLGATPNADTSIIQGAFERLARRYPQPHFPERFRQLL